MNYPSKLTGKHKSQDALGDVDIPEPGLRGGGGEGTLCFIQNGRGLTGKQEAKEDGQQQNPLETEGHLSGESIKRPEKQPLGKIWGAVGRAQLSTGPLLP